MLDGCHSLINITPGNFQKLYADENETSAGRIAWPVQVASAHWVRTQSESIVVNTMFSSDLSVTQCMRPVLRCINFHVLSPERLSAITLSMCLGIGYWIRFRYTTVSWDILDSFMEYWQNILGQMAFIRADWKFSSIRRHRSSGMLLYATRSS